MGDGMVRLGPKLALPVDVVTQAVGILAKRRAGKSYLARRLAEELFAASQQVVVIDPKGDWWGIRSSADGASPGLPFLLLGGERGDLPLESGSGEVVARLVVEERVPAVLDLSLLRKGEAAAWLGVFLESLYRLKAREEFRTPLMLVIDEADAVAPQRPAPGEQRMLGAAEDIVRRGGQRGIGCTMVTQRAAVLNKNVLTQIQVLCVLRTIAPQDLAALGAWVEVHGSRDQQRALMASVASLPVGTAWVWSPGWPGDEGIFSRVEVARIATFDSGSTPRAGEVRREPRGFASVDLGELQRKFSELAAARAASDPRALRRKVEALEAALRSGAASAPSEEALARAFEEGRADGLAKASAQLAERSRPLVAGALLALGRAVDALQSLDASLASGAPVAVFPPHSSGQNEKPGGFTPRARRSAPARARFEAAEGVDGPMQRVLDALAWLEAAGAPRPFPVPQVAAVAGYAPDSGNWRAIVGRLKAAAGGPLVEVRAAGTLGLTGEGRALAAPAESSAEALVDRVLERCDGPMARCLRPLVASYPVALSRADLAARALDESGRPYAPDTGNFRAILGRLSTLGFVEYPERGMVRASPWLFP